MNAKWESVIESICQVAVVAVIIWGLVSCHQTDKQFEAQKLSLQK